MTYLLSMSIEELDAGWSVTDARRARLASRLDELEALGPSHSDEASSVRAELTQVYSMQVDIVKAINEKYTPDEPEASSSRNRGPPSSSKPWSLDEDLTLARSIIDGLPLQDIADKLPTRNIKACRLHIWQLKLEDLGYGSPEYQEKRLKDLEVAHALARPRYKNLWTDEEDAILVQAYQEGLPYEKITDLLSDRTVNACTQRMAALRKVMSGLKGLKRGRIPRAPMARAESKEGEDEDVDVEGTGMENEEESEEADDEDLMAEIIDRTGLEGFIF